MPLKIIHSSFSKIPSIKANSVQVMKVCGSLAKSGHEVELIIPQVTGKSSESAFEFYGVPNRFKIIRTLPLNIITSFVSRIVCRIKS